MALGDAIEALDAGHFLLHGRKGDLLNIAGKRTSLAYLEHQLNAVDGVQDGAFFMPGDSHEGDAQGHDPDDQQVLARSEGLEPPTF